MKQRYGNLVREADLGLFDVILHGCNCQNTMGAGIALTIKKQWPAAYEADTKAFADGKAVLGELSLATVKNSKGGDLVILNCYTQFIPGGSKRPVDYEAIAKCFEKVNDMCSGVDLKIGIPLIGCGLAGGNWKIVEIMAQELMPDLDVTVIMFPEENYMQQVVIHGEITHDPNKDVTTDEADYHASGNVYYEYEGEKFESTRVGLLPQLMK
jgi:O-acetyl-ADP-ribose deacetylase (regulator of RNase III)